EFELRQSFRPSEYLLGQNLTTNMFLVLTLGAKYNITLVNGTQNKYIGLANGFDTKETPLDIETIRFLNLLLSDSRYFLDTKTQCLIEQQPPLVSKECYDGHLREVVKDRRGPSKGASKFLYPTHLIPLEALAKLNIQSLFLGTVCEPLQPALMALLEPLPLPIDKNEFIVYVR
ncbi:hypothetical protein DL95DRAFT_394588, partial [Leptodontidium sp. 2 PMI_412]